MRYKDRHSRGAVVAEAVIVLPAILLLVFGLIQLSVYFSDSLHLHYAAYQGSRQSYLDTSFDALATRAAIDHALPDAELKGIQIGIPGLPGIFADQFTWTIPWGECRNQGVRYRVLDVKYRSPTVLPITFRDSQGREIFPREGLELRARGYCPALEEQ